MQGGFNFPQEERGSRKLDVLAASSSLCQQGKEAHGGNFYSLMHGAGYWCLIHGVHLTFWFMFSSCYMTLSSPQGRDKSCFTALMCPDVAGLWIRQSGQQGPGQGLPVDPNSALGPTTAPHLCPGMANTPIAANLQDSKVCAVVCRDNDSGCWLDHAMNCLIFPLQEGKFLVLFQGCHNTGKVIFVTELMQCTLGKNFLDL